MIVDLVVYILMIVSAVANGLWLYVSVRKLKMLKAASGELIVIKDDEDGEKYCFLNLDSSEVLEKSEYITLKIKRS